MIINVINKPANTPANRPSVTISRKDLPNNQNPDDPSTTFTPGTTDDANVYKNDIIGIRFVVPEGWHIFEESTMQEEMLFGAYSSGSTVRFRIDRFPENNLNDFNAVVEEILPYFSFGTQPGVPVVTKTEVIVINGQTWKNYYFTVLVGEGDDVTEITIVDLFVTDMPNDRGLFIFAVQSLYYTDNHFNTDNPGFDSGREIVQSLEFTK